MESPVASENILLDPYQSKSFLGSWKVAKKAIENKIKKVVFDRNGYHYHGRIKAVADAAREAGLKF